ncbi:ATP-dependent sacrificial sulfur transferase LarE [Anaerovibrio sp.]|uniref:ATP-dependent sacrificial sulfur transferase LarE n=1 Tax=Anaerovibrio sp. TaxID=1872532 RepID=UPI003F136861
MDLKEFFTAYPKVALGFSGGVDSSYLLYAARQCGADVKPYYVKGPFQAEFELQDAIAVAKFAGADNLSILDVNTLEDERVTANDPLRCYYCKCNVFGAIKEQAARDGYEVIIDGTNASDDLNDRTGSIALRELKVLSPLRMSGITKTAIRLLSKEAGLMTWDKPAYACLATRIPTGMPVTKELLAKVEMAESELMSLGYRDFRVRILGNAAKLQLKPEQMAKLMGERYLVLYVLEQYFDEVYLDLKDR